MPWEYLTVKSNDNVTLESAKKQRILNKYGKDDWECFKIEHFNVYTEFTFKRFIKPPAKPRTSKKKEPDKKG